MQSAIIDEPADFATALTGARARCGSVSLLTGNGFSVQARLPFAPPLVNHTALTYPLGPRARSLLSGVSSIAPEDALAYVTGFPAPHPINDDLTSEYNLLRDALTRALLEVHPEQPGAVSRRRLAAGARLFREFDSVFTVNYDLLSYWVMLQKGASSRFTDKFVEIHPDSSSEQTRLHFHANSWPERHPLWFVHGALHLYVSANATAKLRYIDANKTLMEQSIDLYESGRGPLLVLEGSSDRKLSQIAGSTYLQRAFNELGSVSGALFTYGFGFSWQDMHITDQLLRSSILNELWIGLHGDPSSEHNQAIKFRIDRCKSNIARNHISIRYFRSESVPF